MGYARDVLERRRNLEMELEAIRRQMEKIAQVGGCRGSMPRIEKVPGKDDYTYALRGTNNPQGAEIQHLDGYEEALRRHVAKNEDIMVEAEVVISQADDPIDRTILRYYYCDGMNDQRTANRMRFDRSVVSRRRNSILDELDVKLHVFAQECTQQHTRPVV